MSTTFTQAANLTIGDVFYWKENTYKVIGYPADVDPMSLNFDIMVVEKQRDGSWSNEQKFSGTTEVQRKDGW